MKLFDPSALLCNTSLSEIGMAFFGAFGLTVSRRVNTIQSKRMEVLRTLGETTILDVGANEGQYALEVRKSGFEHRILAFEPAPAVYEILSKRFEGDSKVICEQTGVGDKDGELSLFARRSSACSSFRDTNIAQQAAPGFEIQSAIKVPIRRLDTILAHDPDRYFLKIDTQGYEKEVLLGASMTLDRTDAIEIELSLSPLYEGQALLEELWRFITSRGFRPAWIERGYRDPNDIWLMQIDALFVRPERWKLRSHQLIEKA
jgi:FkbM family methyltransferase